MDYQPVLATIDPRETTGKRLSIAFPPQETALSERDKARLSMLAWPYLEDHGAQVRIRAYLPADTTSARRGTAVEMDRGQSVRRYLAHLGLPRDRTQISLVESQASDNGADRVEIDVIGIPTEKHTSQPSTTLQPEIASAQTDRSRTIKLRALHEQLRAFTLQNPHRRQAVPTTQAPQRAPLPDQSSSADRDRNEVIAQQPSVPSRPSSTQTQRSGKAHLDVQEAKAVSGGNAVQLASLPDRGVAEAERARLAERHAELLAGMSLRLEEVDLAGRGRFHRIQTQPLASRREAATLCLEFKARGQDCFVVAVHQVQKQQIASNADS